MSSSAELTTLAASADAGSPDPSATRQAQQALITAQDQSYAASLGTTAASTTGPAPVTVVLGTSSSGSKTIYLVGAGLAAVALAYLVWKKRRI